MHRFLSAFLIPAVLIPVGALSAAESVGHLGKTLPRWRSELHSPERLDRLIAARAIGEMAIAGRNSAAKVLFEAIEHDDSAVRYWAVVAVGQLGARARPALRRLRRALADEAPEVQAWAAYALARLGETEKALPVLATLMTHPNRGVRLQAAHVLDALGKDAAGATQALQVALDDDFGYVQRVARHALWTLGERPCPYQQCE